MLPRTNRSYLLTYDPITFYSYLETIKASNTVTATGGAKQNVSAWLFTEAANVIFTTAKARCYLISKARPKKAVTRQECEQDDQWEILDELEGRPGATHRSVFDNGEAEGWKDWMPSGMVPTLEELPKWQLLADVLLEIESGIMSRPLRAGPSFVSFFCWHLEPTLVLLQGNQAAMLS